jgi:hypothetical protein
LEYESACNRLRDDIATVLLELERPAIAATSLAATATYHLADALHHAAGAPNDGRWEVALSSLARFVDVCSRSARASRCDAYATLRAFVGENANAPRVSAQPRHRAARATRRSVETAA